MKHQKYGSERPYDDAFKRCQTGSTGGNGEKVFAITTPKLSKIKREPNIITLCDRYLYAVTASGQLYARKVDYKSVEKRKNLQLQQWFQGNVLRMANWSFRGLETEVDEDMTYLHPVLLVQLLLSSVAMPYVAEFPENERVFDSRKHFVDLIDTQQDGANIQQDRVKDARSIAVFALGMEYFHRPHRLYFHDDGETRVAIPPDLWPEDDFDQTTPRPEPDHAKEQREEEEVKSAIKADRESLPTATIASV